jgi:hypothetical protein
VGIVTVLSQACTLAETPQLDRGTIKNDPMKSKTIKKFFRKHLIIVTSHFPGSPDAPDSAGLDDICLWPVTFGDPANRIREN